MCYNCGCKNPNDNMGDPNNITNDTFKKAAQASTQSDTEAKLNTLELLQEQTKESK